MNQELEETKEIVELTLEQVKELGLLEEPEKKYTYLFDNEINQETVQELISILHNYSTIDLFFTTEGGYTTAMEVLISYLNSRKEDITIILTNEICSAGTFILTDFEGCIKLSKNLDFIMFHLVDRMGYTLRKGILNKKQLTAQLKESNIELIEKYTALGLTSQEIKKFKSGDDVILYKKDFHRLNIKCE